MIQKEAFEQYFEKLLKEHDKKAKDELKVEKVVEKKRNEKIDYKLNNDDENLAKINNENMELESKVKEFEEANKLIR